MAGNVFQGCWDWYDLSYPSGNQTDPTGPSSSPYGMKVGRGGCYSTLVADVLVLGSANRAYASPLAQYDGVGFRVVAP